MIPDYEFASPLLPVEFSNLEHLPTPPYLKNKDYNIKCIIQIITNKNILFKKIVVDFIKTLTIDLKEDET